MMSDNKQKHWMHQVETVSTCPPEGRRPRQGAGRVDAPGIVPEDVHVDPEITEGHAGYQESGRSEIILKDQLIGGGTTRKQ
jgi:hypothetical protein